MWTSADTIEVTKHVKCDERLLFPEALLSEAAMEHSLQAANELSKRTDCNNESLACWQAYSYEQYSQSVIRHTNSTQ